MTFVNPAASVAVAAVDSHHLLGLYLDSSMASKERFDRFDSPVDVCSIGRICCTQAREESCQGRFRAGDRASA